MSWEENKDVLAAQNDWINAQMKAWQVAWHDAFDRDAALLATGEFDRDDVLPEDLCADVRLTFGFSHASIETRARCFALLPEGAEMHRRFEHYMSGARETLDEAAARDVLAELGRAAEACEPNEVVNWDEVVVMDLSEFQASDTWRKTSNIGWLFERSLFDPLSDEMLPRVAAELFLGEPLYASCGNQFELRDWVTGALFRPELDRVRTLCFRLWDGGWQPLLFGDGVMLVRDDRG